MRRVAPVHVWLPGNSEPTLAGEFSLDPENRTGRFTYAAAYLAARHPALAPDLPLRAKPLAITGGSAIFPLFQDAGPDAWGRHLLMRRLERDSDELEVLTLCPTDGVGNIALGELSAERSRVLSPEQFLATLATLEAGRPASSDLDEQVWDAVQNGTSLGGTKPKLTVAVNGTQYLAKFPQPGDSRWLPHLECAMLNLARACGIDACRGEVWTLPGGQRHALVVQRFDRVTLSGQDAADAGIGKKGYISAHALLRLDMATPTPDETLQYGTQGFTTSGLRRSYVALASESIRWCANQASHRELRRELWRRIVFNALILNVDDHAKNHGLLCHDMLRQHWALAPAFDLVPAQAAATQPALAMAYRYVPVQRRGRQTTPPRLVTRLNPDDLLAAASEHYGFSTAEAREYLAHASAMVTEQGAKLLRNEGIPEGEIERMQTTFLRTRAFALPT